MTEHTLSISDVLTNGVSTRSVRTLLVPSVKRCRQRQIEDGRREPIGLCRDHYSQVCSHEGWERLRLVQVSDTSQLLTFQEIQYCLRCRSNTANYRESTYAQSDRRHKKATENEDGGECRSGESDEERNRTSRNIWRKTGEEEKWTQGTTKKKKKNKQKKRK